MKGASRQSWAALSSDDRKSGSVTGGLNSGAGGGLSADAYRELRVIAHAQLRSRRADATLNTTALINEAYVKLGSRRQLWRDRKHFYATMARVMRQVTIDLARKPHDGWSVDLGPWPDFRRASFSRSDCVIKVKGGSKERGLCVF